MVLTAWTDKHVTLWKGFLVKLRCRNFGCFMPCSRNAKTQLDLHEQKSGISHRYCILDLSCKSALIKRHILIGWTTFEAIIKQSLYQLNSIIKVQFKKILFTQSYEVPKPTYCYYFYRTHSYSSIPNNNSLVMSIKLKKSRTLYNIFLCSLIIH